MLWGVHVNSKGYSHFRCSTETNSISCGKWLRGIIFLGSDTMKYKALAVLDAALLLTGVGIPYPSHISALEFVKCSVYIYRSSGDKVILKKVEYTEL